MRQKGSKEGGGSWFWMLCILRRRRIVLPPPFHVIGKKDVARSEQGNVPNGIHAVGDSTVLPFQYSTGRTTGPEREAKAEVPDKNWSAWNARFWQILVELVVEDGFGFLQDFHVLV